MRESETGYTNLSKQCSLAHCEGEGEIFSRINTEKAIADPAYRVPLVKVKNEEHYRD